MNLANSGTVPKNSKKFQIPYNKVVVKLPTFTTDNSIIMTRL